MNYKTLIPSIVGVLMAVATALTPMIQGFLASNPTISMILVAIYGILANFVTSPTAKKPE